MNDAHLDELLDRLVTVEPRPAWDDVMSRARRSHRRFVVMTAVVALFLLVPTAWAVDSAFFGSPPPDGIKSGAAALDKLDAHVAAASAKLLGLPNDSPKPDLAKLHGLMQVPTPDGPLDVWAAPTNNGGLCAFSAFEADRKPGKSFSEVAALGCWPTGDPAHDNDWETARVHPDVYLTNGYIHDPDATSAGVTFRIGANVLSKTVPVVEGFYVAVFPRDPSATLSWDEDNVGLERVIAYDSSGNELESWRSP